MSKKARYGRPDRGSLLATMVLNAFVSWIVLTLVLKVFGLYSIIPRLPNSHALTGVITLWSMIWPMLPGAAIAYGCLWYWLILVGRTRGVSWGGACIYGVLIALADVPICGLVLGTLQGVPLLGLLIGLVMLLVMPVLLLAMLVFGLLMGLYNGWLAANWIERSRS